MSRGLLLGLALVGACAAGPTAGARVAFEEADVARAQRAPDLFARAERARERAEAAADRGDDEAAGDLATEARLWLRAAMVEADRLELEEARLVDEREEEQLAQALSAAREERRAYEASVGRERAADVAREQMERAFEAAELRETRRRNPSGPDTMAAARAFLDRSRLLVAAAHALGAPAEGVTELLTALERGPSSRDGDAALRDALLLHRQALTLLGRARATSPVTPAVIASLVEAAGERRIDLALTPDGAFVTMGRGDDAKLTDLLRAFPHGPVRIAGRGARRLATTLSRSEIDEARLLVDESRDPLTVQLPAYGTDAGLPAEEEPEAVQEE